VERCLACEADREQGKIALDVRFAFYALLAISLSYYHFNRGGFLTSQAGTKGVDYFSSWLSYTF
jgi:hypothetical protein